MPHPVTHFEIIGKDGKKLQEFYGKLFDWHVDANNPMNYGIVDTHTEGGIGGGIGQAMDGQKMVTFYVQVDDVQAYLEKATGLGGKTVMPKMDVPGGPTIAQVADPEGNVIGLVQ